MSFKRFIPCKCELLCLRREEADEIIYYKIVARIERFRGIDHLNS